MRRAMMGALWGMILYLVGHAIVSLIVGSPAVDAWRPVIALVAATLASAEKFGYGPRYLDEFPDRVRAVTREQVDAVIRSRLHPEKLHLVVAGDLDSIPE